MIEKFLSCPSVSGKTDQMIKLLKGELSALFDNDKTDSLGSVCFTKKLGEGQKLLVSCAIDVPGLIATFTEGTQISVSSIGGFDVPNVAFSRVVFENAHGVLVPPSAFDHNAPITDYVVETENEAHVKKVTLGDVGYFDIPASLLGDKAFGFGAALKTCIYTSVMLAKKLLADDAEFLKNEGIGEVSFAFVSHENLGNRGSSCVSFAQNPDLVINIAPIDMTEKNVGTLTFDDGLAIKMMDKSFVADIEAAFLAERLLDKAGLAHKRRVSNKAVSAVLRLGLCEKGARCVEICLPAKYLSTSGECVRVPFSAPSNS